MAFIENLGTQQFKNLKLILKHLQEIGISNRFTQAGILAVVSKETAFNVLPEKGFGQTSNERIRKIFGNRVAKLNDEQLNQIKVDNEKFFNLVYGGIYGNAANEGYKYRGRGFNGITFKSAYQQMNAYILQETGIDMNIVENPDLLTSNPDIAAMACAGYFKLNIPKVKLSIYGMTNINDAPNIDSGVGVAYHANAGIGFTLEQLKLDTTGGRKLAFDRSKEMLAIVDLLEA